MDNFLKIISVTPSYLEHCMFVILLFITTATCIFFFAGQHVIL